jgi:heme exporter protein A
LFDALSVTVNAGELLEITGPNGSGKSTLLRIIAGLGQAHEGDVFWRGESAAQQQQQMRADTLYLGHAVGVKTALSVMENLRWSTELKSPFNAARAAQALDALSLAGYEDVRCGSLSAGQQRRVALARLYTCDCPLWVLDEPFTALDKKGIAHLQALFQQHLGQGGSIVLTTHQTLDAMPNIKRLGL